MYYCMNCDVLEILYFECKKCNKKFCRKCVSPDKHKCMIANNFEYKLDMFCDFSDCIENKKLINCKSCKKKFCSSHFTKHKCKVKSCSIM